MEPSMAIKGQTPDPAWSTGRLRTAIERLSPLHRKLGTPGPGDWLASHPETGQTFSAYVASRPMVPGLGRRTIVIQPIGGFTESQRRVVARAAEFIGLFYGLPVKIAESLPLSVIPAGARRKHPSWDDEQILTAYVLNRILKPGIPDEAFAYIAFTASDLWPGENWNFVFTWK